VELMHLDYLYTPSTDVAGDVAFLTEVLGGELAFAIDDGGTKVAMVTVGEGPGILLTDHLAGERPIHVLAVKVLATAISALAQRGCTIERQVELPPGSAATFRSPAGLRFAIYERTRPLVVESFRGRRDF
jgi:hypothetical protein